MAGEGSFFVARRPIPFVANGTDRLRFVFQLNMADRDHLAVRALFEFLGVGSIRHARPRKANWLPATILTVSSERAHRDVTIPFAERFLPRWTAKYRQFEAWRAEFEAYIDRRPSQYNRGRSECSQPDCNKPVRGRGLCRSHYYRATGY